MFLIYYLVWWLLGAVNGKPISSRTFAFIFIIYHQYPLTWDNHYTINSEQGLQCNLVPVKRKLTFRLHVKRLKNLTIIIIIRV